MEPGKVEVLEGWFDHLYILTMHVLEKLLVVMGNLKVKVLTIID